jgi:hypothetical protein
MKRRFPTIFATACIAVAVTAPGAVAAEPDYGDLGSGGPGRSAADQYRESAPGGGTKKRVPETTRKRLAQQGDDGEALAAALDRNGASPTDTGSTAGGSAASAGATDTDRSTSATGGGKDADDGTGAATAGGSGGGTQGGTSAPASESASADQESATQVAAASTVGAKVGPVPLWVAMVAIGGVALAAGVLRWRRVA